MRYIGAVQVQNGAERAANKYIHRRDGLPAQGAAMPRKVVGLVSRIRDYMRGSQWELHSLGKEDLE